MEDSGSEIGINLNSQPGDSTSHHHSEEVISDSERHNQEVEPFLVDEIIQSVPVSDEQDQDIENFLAIFSKICLDLFLRDFAKPAKLNHVDLNDEAMGMEFINNLSDINNNDSCKALANSDLE